MVKRIAAIVPAYNEENTIASVVNDIHAINDNEFCIDVIVINDCSQDKTAEIAFRLDCILLDLPVNLGIGGAVQTGFKYAFEKEYDFAIQIDGDGQHPPYEIPKLFHSMNNKEMDVVIGSRFIEKKGFNSTFIRRLGIFYFKYILRLYCGINVTDSTSGFRILNRKALAIVSEIYPDEYPEPESIILYSKHNLKIGEVSVNMRERMGGQSSIRAFTSLYYMMKVSIAIFFTYFRYRNLKSKT